MWEEKFCNLQKEYNFQTSEITEQKKPKGAKHAIPNS